MQDEEKSAKDNEAIMIALDQISQTIDVMTSVVGRLRTSLQQQESASDQSAALHADMQAGRVLH